MPERQVPYVHLQQTGVPRGTEDVGTDRAVRSLRCVAEHARGEAAFRVLHGIPDRGWAAAITHGTPDRSKAAAALRILHGALDRSGTDDIDIRRVLPCRLRCPPDHGRVE